MKFVKILVFVLTYNLAALGQDLNYDKPFRTTEDIASAEMKKADNRIRMRRGFADHGYDVNYYRCEWQVDPAIKFIAGTVTVYFKPIRNLQSLVLDLSKTLTVKSVSYHNAPATFLRSDTTVSVQLPATAISGKQDSVTISYEGVPFDSGFGSFAAEKHAGIPVMWTLSQPYGAVDWWPCKNTINDKADSIDVYITYPQQYTSAGNGSLKSERILGGKKTSHWQHRYPIATYLIAFAVSNYSLQTDTVVLSTARMPIQNWYYPENAGSFTANLPMLFTAMQFFDRMLGPYPFIREKYGQVQFNWSGGMEHQTCSFILNTSRLLMSHELAHQWFGNKVTAKSWEDIWLQEGFATYLEVLERTMQDVNAQTAARKGLITNISSQPGGSVWVPDTNNVSRLFSSRLSYNKGAYLAIMLEEMLGRDVFFAALRSYLDDPRFAYGNATTSDLKEVLEKATGKSLARFFEQWYKGEGYPSYAVQWYYSTDKKVSIRLTQTTSHPSVGFYQMPVPVVIMGGGRSKKIILDHKASGETFTETIDFVPDTLLFDPELAILSANNSVVKVDAPVVSSPGIFVRTTAANGIDIMINAQAGKEVSVSLYDASGRRIYTNRVALQTRMEQINIPKGTMAGGIYFIKVKGLQIDFSATVVR